MSNFADFRHRRFFRYAPLILCIGVILFASTGSASMSETSRFVRPLLEFLFPDASPETLVVYHNYIRKLAHFTEYGILAFFASRAFSDSGRRMIRRYWAVSAFGLVALTAAVDEINQSFNAARTGSIYDVMLDCAGGLAMIAVFYAAKRLFAGKKTA